MADGGGKIARSDAEWRRRLTREQYDVARRGGTERPFTGAYWDSKAPGTYACICCGTPLFAAADKYDSGTGWPSFTRPLDRAAVATARDTSVGHGPHRGAVRPLRRPSRPRVRRRTGADGPSLLPQLGVVEAPAGRRVRAPPTRP